MAEAKSVTRRLLVQHLSGLVNDPRSRRRPSPFTWQDQHQFDVPILSFCCPQCESFLTLHQPDPELPDRLLATCEDCKSWYLTAPKGNSLIPIPRTTL